MGEIKRIATMSHWNCLNDSKGIITGRDWGREGPGFMEIEIQS